LGLCAIFARVTETRVKFLFPNSRRTFFLSALFFLFVFRGQAALRDVIVPTNVVVRVMAANVTGNSQKYEPFAIRIFQGLKPDIIAIQEFNYSNNTPAQIRSFIDTAFGTNFYYFRETGAGYQIPNGVISRYPFVATGAWTDAQISNRGFAWARIDLPGTNDLYVVSVHLKAGSSDASVRSAQATALKSLIQSNFPSNAWIVLAGDMNIYSYAEAAMNTFRTFLSATPVPADQLGNTNTNNGRNEPYDQVLTSPTFTTNITSAVIGAQSFGNGLVFDSRVYTPLSAVSPVQSGDSGLAQHMAVMKDFRIHYVLTNTIEVPRPLLVQSKTNFFRWQAVPGITYTVERSVTLTNWLVATQMMASTTNLAFTNLLSTNAYRFYRVSY
jgi:endonuclease/exonuclease/phosphatase family metal-dependent hydrolase